MVVIVAAATVTVALAAQTEAVTWSVPADVTAADRRAILQLARQLKIDDPQRVSTYDRNETCRSVTVVSERVEGNRVSSRWIWIRRAAGKGCDPVLTGQQVKQVGNWLTYSAVASRDERWRVRDGNWHIDIHLGNDVPYEDAAIVVRAIRRGNFADQRLQDQRRRRLAPTEADVIGIVSRPPPECTPAPHPRLYEVGMWRGNVSFLLRIVANRVELVEHREWIP